jgi:hypothetical protein
MADGVPGGIRVRRAMVCPADRPRSETGRSPERGGEPALRAETSPDRDLYVSRKRVRAFSILRASKRVRGVVPIDVFNESSAICCWARGSRHLRRAPWLRVGCGPPDSTEFVGASSNF